MELLAKSSGGDRQLPSTGIQQGILYQVVDLGTQQVEYKGTKKLQRKLNVGWELPNAPPIEYEENGNKIMRPQCIFKKYTLSLFKGAALAKDLAGWRGQGFTKKEETGFDVFNMLVPGVNALLNIVHYDYGDGEKRAGYDSIAKLMEGMKDLERENPVIQYITSMGDNFPESMPEWMITTIKDSPEYNRAVSGANSQELNETQQALGVEDTTDYSEENNPKDDIPF